MMNHSVRIDGHDVSRADAIAHAMKVVTAAGMSAHAAEDALVDRPGLVARAWWRDEPGEFVQEHHDGARPVTVVNIDWETPDHDA